MPADFIDELDKHGNKINEKDMNFLSLFRNPMTGFTGYKRNPKRARISLTDNDSDFFHYIIQLDNIFEENGILLCRWSIISTIEDEFNEEPFATFILTESENIDIQNVNDLHSSRCIFHDQNICVIQGIITKEHAEIKLVIPDNIRAMRLDAKNKY